MRTSHVREHWIRFLFACYVLGYRLSLAQTPEQTKQMNGIVGGSVTFPAPVLKTGTLSNKDQGAAAMVMKGSSDTELIKQFTGRLQWDNQTGLFTITHLRTEDSGTYIVNCKEEQSKLTFTFQLEVYKNVSSPTVTWIQSERKNCSVLCFVENGREVTLSWLRDGENLFHTSSPDTNTSLSLLLELEREGHTYYCETKNPVSSQLYRLDVPSSCTEDSDKKLPVPDRDYKIPLVVTMCLVLCILVVGFFLFLKRRKKHFAQDTDTSRQRASVHYAELSHGSNQSNQAETQNIKLTTVYDELQLCRVSAAAEQC
ncbi:SLAM family member 5-like isoform X2 [Anguilla anguilla]|uniref:SLAM family member 5-like isoform X2 n=1 Tax=Anguilla anguilla TaxID=7936 RepID=UPI0015AA9BD6|nr:SLAM family member 5-like isoform X2 [Anguilla anguilla]